MTLLVGAAAPAGAHGDIQATDPARGATLPRSPGSVAITFTEAPTRQAVLEVEDGCGRSVHQGIEVADATATVRLAVGQPGKWRVSYNVISALDGHQTRGGYAFTVRGQRDCNPDDPTPDPTAPDDGAAGPTGDDDDAPGSGAPVIPIALGAAGVLALALILRRSGSS